MRSVSATYTFKKLQAFQLAEVWQNTETGEQSLHAAQSFTPSQVICSFAAATTLSYPTYLTIQTTLHTHITLTPFYLQYVNYYLKSKISYWRSVKSLKCPLRLEMILIIVLKHL